MSENYKSLEDIYKYLEPSDMSGGQTVTRITQENLFQLIMRLFLDPKGIFYTYSKIQEDFNTHLSGKKTSSEVQENLVAAKKDLKKYLHIIGTSGRVNFDDGDYWGESIKTIEQIISLPKSTSNDNFIASAVVSRSPYVSPATCGTDYVDRFLNYSPPLSISQLVPYFDVEFQLTRTVPSQGGKRFLNTPSYMRFLLGSVSLDSNSLSDADKILAATETLNVLPPPGSSKAKNSNSTQRSENKEISFSGMENFLMPQTLTNMGSLGPDNNNLSTRYAPVKPFLPLASVEGFDVNVSNAGAGDFAHKKASLKLKIHDKARIGEFSDFIKGSSGFNEAVIWTTYGWLAPSRKDDEYFNFINDNMLVRECWQVVNTQFSFDTSGQVSLNLELVSKANKSLRSLSISEDNEKLLKYHELLKMMGEIKLKLSGENKVSLSVTSEEVLNAASSTGSFSKIKDLNNAIKNLVKSVQTSSLTSEERTAFEEGLNSLRGDYNYDEIKKTAAASVKQKFEKLAIGTDPFLPRENSDYFSDHSEVIEEIKKFNSTSKQRNAAIDAAKETAKIDLKPSSEVVSFGKLFLSFFVPSVRESKDSQAAEVQVFFYGLNDKCGPMSGLSIAEFPINMTTLAYAYAETIKNSKVEVLNVTDFMRIVMETQFADERAIGYGRSSFYEPWNPDKPKEKVIPEKTKAIVEEGIANWSARYGSLQMPSIEVFVEEGENSSGTNASGAAKDVIRNLKKGGYTIESQTRAKKFIKRIHIYDRTNNPFKTPQNVLDSGETVSLGKIDVAALRRKSSELANKLSEQQRDTIDRLIREGKSYSEALTAAGAEKSSIDEFKKIVDSGRIDYKIPKDRRSFKHNLMRSVPSIRIGTSGTLVLSANVASKTDGTMGAINIINANKGASSSKATASTNPLEDQGGLPLRSVPVQLTMSTMGVPIARLYQTFFVDFDTGTTLDNLYNCTAIQHTLAQGKFTTNWTFAYNPGYGKFSAPQTAEALISGQITSILRKLKEEKTAKEDKAKGKTKGKGNK